MAREKWILSTLKPAPSMQESEREFVGTFAEACQEARNEYATHGRRVSVKSDDSTTHWFTINANGEKDNNTPPASRINVSAAPDLLAACKAALHPPEYDADENPSPCSCSICVKLRAAIAKATA